MSGNWNTNNTMGYNTCLEKLEEKLNYAGGFVEHSSIQLDEYTEVSILYHLNRQLYIFKIALITPSFAHATLNDAMSQLYEYRFRRNLINARLVLVINQPLPVESEWMLDYFEYHQKITLLWFDDKQLHASFQTRAELAFLWPS